MEDPPNKNHKECQSELRRMFTRLKSWQEESQREFSNIMNSQSIIIDKGIDNLVEEVGELQAQLSAVKKERDNLLETVADMGSEITKLQAKLPSSDALPDTEQNPCQDAEEIDCQRSQDQDVEVGSKMNIDDNDLEDHIDDAVGYPETFSSIEGVTDEDEVTDKTEERETVHLTNEGLPEIEIETNHDLKTHIESIHKMGKNRLKCKYCPYWNDRMSQMKDHVEGVHGKKRFNCGECKFTRSRKRDLMRHIREVHQEGQNI